MAVHVCMTKQFRQVNRMNDLELNQVNKNVFFFFFFPGSRLCLYHEALAGEEEVAQMSKVGTLLRDAMGQRF